MSEQHRERARPRRRTILGGKIFDQQVNLKIERFNKLIRSEIIWSREGEAGVRFVSELVVVPKSMQKIFGIMTGV